MKRLVIATVALAMFAAPLHAQATIAVGQGLRQCGEWTAARRYPVESGSPQVYEWLAIETWLQGYFVGTVQVLRGSSPAAAAALSWDEIPQPATIESFVDNYCQVHPLDR